MKSKKGYDYGTRLVNALETGAFVKDFRPNHGSDFTGGLENLHRERFRLYMGSCGCFLMDLRLASGTGEYYG